MVSAGYNASGNPLPGAGLGNEPTANIGVMVSQELPYPGKRDPSAGSRAGMARDGFSGRPKFIRPRRALAYCGQQMVMTNGSTLAGMIR